MTAAKYRRPLNREQLAVLQWLYQYRFSTSKQLASYLLKPNPKAIQNKLQILEQQGFIGKHYDKSYKLAGQAAEYYLAPSGARRLASYHNSLPETDKNRQAIEASVVKALYKNKTVSDSFIQHCLIIVDTVQHLKDLYGDKLQIFSQATIAAYDYFLSWKPDVFLSLKTSDEMQRYFLDIWDDTKPFFVGVRKMRNYLNDQENNGWLEGYDYPYVLAICKDDTTQKKLNRQVIKALNENYITDEITYATTTIERLRSATKPTDKIWSKVDLDDEPERLSLKNLYS